MVQVRLGDGHGYVQANREADIEKFFREHPPLDDQGNAIEWDEVELNHSVVIALDYRKQAIALMEKVTDGFMGVGISSRASASKTWHCCRTNIFHDLPWLIMIWCFFLVLGNLTYVCQLFTLVFTVAFHPNLRELRKIMGLVWAHREHSLAHQQLKSLIAEACAHFTTYHLSDRKVKLPFYPFALVLIEAGLLQQVGALCCFDGSIIILTNWLYEKMPFYRSDCRLTVAVVIIIVFNIVIGATIIFCCVPVVIWSSCFWGSNSQSMASLYGALLPSFCLLTYKMPHIMVAANAVLAAYPGPPPPADLKILTDFAASGEIQRVVAVGYDVERIKAAEAKNHSHLADFRKGLARLWRKMKWD